MKELHYQTPLYESFRLKNQLNKNIYFKMECYQPSFSFKMRGMGALCQSLLAQGHRHLVCSSGGNAGYSVAYAGHRLGLKVTIVVPTTTGLYMRKKIEELGATVLVHGDVWDEAHAQALALTKEWGAAYVHPFLHPTIWTGHSSMIDECVAEIPEPDLVIVSVGGGGLLCGVLEGMQRNSWTKAKVLAAETHGAASYAAALEKGEPVTLKSIDSIAKTLGAKRVCDESIAWAKQHTIQSELVSDAQAVEACRLFADDFKVLVEPACGAALSLVYEPVEAVKNAESVLVIACGGAAMNLQDFNELMIDFKSQSA